MLTLHKVSKFFGQRCVLKEVSLSVSAGSITLLMGANGSGKTTLLRMMAGLTKPSLGQVAHGVDERYRAYLGHNTFLYPALTAVENLQFWGQAYNIAPDNALLSHIMAVLERVELSPFAEEKAGVFSRGMAQRLNLARVLLLQPKLWLMDEPSTGLDVRSTLLLQREVLAAKESGAAIVWISHDKESDAPLADRIAYIEKTRLHFEQKTEEPSHA